MRAVAATVFLLLAGCGGGDGVKLDDAALPVAKAHVEALYAQPCTAATDRCAAHTLHESFRWQVQEARLVAGCKPTWPEVDDAPAGDCVEIEVGGAGCAPAQTATGLTRQVVLRTVRVWLAPAKDGYRVTSDAWQVAGGSDTLEPC